MDDIAISEEEKVDENNKKNTYMREIIIASCFFLILLISFLCFFGIKIRYFFKENKKNDLNNKVS